MDTTQHSTHDLNRMLLAEQIKHQQLENTLLSVRVKKAMAVMPKRDSNYNPVDEVVAERQKLGGLPKPLSATEYRVLVTPTAEGNRYWVSILHNDKVKEQYAPVDKDTAQMYLQALLNGFQPPRSLVRLDIPTG